MLPPLHASPGANSNSNPFTRPVHEPCTRASSARVERVERVDSFHEEKEFKAYATLKKAPGLLTSCFCVRVVVVVVVVVVVFSVFFNVHGPYGGSWEKRRWGFPRHFCT